MAVTAGVAPDRVWGLTPAEVDAAVEAFVEQQEHQRRLALTLAWVNAALQRQKRLPRLEKIIRRPGALAPQKTQAEMKQDWETLKGRFAQPETVKKRTP